MFTLFLQKHGFVEPVKYEITYTKFSAGEIKLALPAEACGDLQHTESLTVYARLNSSDDIMALAMLNDALIQAKPKKFIRRSLVIPYMPYGRQDRVCNPGEAASGLVFATLVNGLTFDEVVTFDPHNPTVFDYQIFTGQYVPQEEILCQYFTGLCYAEMHGVENPHVTFMMENFTDPDTILGTRPYLKELIPQYVVVAPDKGARKKAEKVTNSVFGGKCIYANKVRNPETMEITSTEILPAEDGQDIHIEGKHLIVVDDICDGGRTFIELAKELRKHNPASLTLYITHAIFSRGVAELKEYYDMIIHTDSIRGHEQYTDGTICIPFFENSQPS